MISTLSNWIAELSLCTKWHVTWHLHVISVWCVARDLHTIAHGPLECTCWRQFVALWGDCKKSRIVPSNAIIIIIKHIHINALATWAYMLGAVCSRLYKISDSAFQANITIIIIKILDQCDTYPFMQNSKPKGFAKLLRQKAEWWKDVEQWADQPCVSFTWFIVTYTTWRFVSWVIVSRS